MTEVHTALVLLRLGIGFTMVCFGLSQLRHPGMWLVYLPHWLQHLLPMKPTTFMREHALGNFFLGLLFMIPVWRPELIAWAVAAWWLTILPFALWHDRFVGLRDLAIILASVATAILYRA
jgi:hypothetical protein